MTTKNTKREYCTGCRRWIATWKRNSWGTNSWGNPTMRPAFGKYCEHGRWCSVCWFTHSEAAHREARIP